MIPTTLPTQDTVSWVPVDTTANIILDLVLATANSPPTLHHYNIVNPTPGAWSTLISTVTSYFASTKPIEPVPFSSWLSALQASAALGTEDVAKNPGIKLLDFYGSMDQEGAEDEVMLETEQTRAASESMRRLGAVGKEWMETWLVQWAF